MHEDGKGRKVAGSRTKAPPFFAGTVIGSAAKKKEPGFDKKQRKAPNNTSPSHNNPAANKNPNLEMRTFLSRVTCGRLNECPSCFAAIALDPRSLLSKCHFLRAIYKQGDVPHASCLSLLQELITPKGRTRKRFCCTFFNAAVCIHARPL